MGSDENECMGRVGAKRQRHTMTMDMTLAATIGKPRLTSGLMGLLTGPHQMSLSEEGSLTIRLSMGERPVFAPE